jgi:hypothetical protein
MPTENEVRAIALYQSQFRRHTGITLSTRQRGALVKDFWYFANKIVQRNCHVGQARAKNHNIVSFLLAHD